MTFQEQKAEALGKALENFQEAVTKIVQEIPDPLEMSARLYIAYSAFKTEVFLILQTPDPSRFPPGTHRTIVDPNYKENEKLAL